MQKKIAIVNNGLSMGGIERASSSMANAFRKKGYNVIVISLYKREKFFTLESGIKFYEPVFIKSNRYIYSIKMVFYLIRTLKKTKPDVILAFGEWTNSFVVIAARMLHIKIYLSDRMSPILNLGYIQEKFKRYIYKAADGIIAQTEFAKDIIIDKTHNRNVTVIPNPVNIIERIDCKQKNQIITIGRLTKEKGHSVLIEAFAKIKKLNWDLKIVGDGPLRKDLENLSINLGLHDKINFAGHQKDLSTHLSESKIFVLPSLSEGFPNALIEAMSLPIACISSDCIAGPKDIIENRNNGILVAPNDANALAQAIEEVINNDNLRVQISKNAYSIRDKYSFDSISETYLNFIIR